MSSTTTSSSVTKPPGALRLAEWVAVLRFDDLPDDVVMIARSLLLDQAGLQIRGRRCRTSAR